MASFIELIAKIKQKNNGTFKLVDAQDVECEDGKGLDEVLNEKLDKNQGVENAGKTMVVGADGNLVVGDSSPKNVYTKEEVDYLLDDKMDKPYVPIEITDNATITDALEGNFKIDKLKGNTYQKVETNIVPTPQRPVPINSRKTTITKVNPNIFDLEKESDTSSIPDTGTYRSIGQHQLKANTKYIFEWTEATVPAKATLSLQIQNDKGTVLVSAFTYFNLETTEKKEAGKQVEFTTNESGIVKFAYNCMVATSSTTETYQQYWYTKILKDISLKEDVEYATEYVELRSLKETSNLFDKNIMAFTSGTLNGDGTVGTNVSYAVSGFAPVKPSTQYTIKVIDGFRSSTKVYYDVNKQLISNEGSTTFTTPSNCYFVRWQTATTDTRVLTEEDIQKINDEMMMVKGNSLPSSYIPPTVRDYKIVDHATQTSKIVRNVGTRIFDGSDDENVRYILDGKRFYITVSDLLSNNISNNKNLIVCDSYNYNSQIWSTEDDKYGMIANRTDIIFRDLRFDTVELFRNNLKVNNVFVQYPLATSIEESISYIETDTSEVGYSWQDTTSPSPTIKSEVKGVEKIDVLKTGKNLFDIDGNVNTIGNTQGAKNSVQNGILTSNYNYSNEALGGQLIKIENGKQYTISLNVISIGTGSGAYIAIYRNGEPIYSPNTKVGVWKTTITATVDEILLAFGTNNGTGAQFTNIQIEQSDTATAYEPYTEQRVNITLPQPLYQNDVANVESGDYEYCTKNTTIDFNRFDGNLDLIQENTVRYYFHKNFVQEFDGIILDTLLFDCFTNVNDDSDTVHFKIGGTNNEYIFIYIPRGHTDNKAYAKEYLSSLNLIANFAVETKTTQPIPEEDLKLLKSLKTEQGVTNIFVSGEVKPTIEARYPRDLALVQQQLEQKILLISDSLIDTQAKVLLQGGN